MATLKEWLSGWLTASCQYGVGPTKIATLKLGISPSLIARNRLSPSKLQNRHVLVVYLLLFGF